MSDDSHVILFFSNYEWEKVTHEDDIPNFYKTCSGRRKSRDELNFVKLEETKEETTSTESAKSSSSTKAKLQFRALSQRTKNTGNLTPG